MLKYFSTSVVFSEIPDEITLGIELSKCPIHCPDCHSKHLWEDIGIELTIEELDKILNTPAITCVCFLGGDNDSELLLDYINYIKSKYNLKTAWYSGKVFPITDKYNNLDYIKQGPFIKELGPLNSKTTNQKMFKKYNGIWKDITNKFWKKEDVALSD